MAIIFHIYKKKHNNNHSMLVSGSIHVHDLCLWRKKRDTERERDTTNNLSLFYYIEKTFYIKIWYEHHSSNLHKHMFNWIQLDSPQKKKKKYFVRAACCLLLGWMIYKHCLPVHLSLFKLRQNKMIWIWNNSSHHHHQQ